MRSIPADIEPDDADPATAQDTQATGSDFPFEAMNLKVGTRVQVQPPPRLSSERGFVRLIGFVYGQSLLITTPKNAQGMTLQLHDGEELVMRAFSGQNAFAFGCSVQRVCKVPYSYLHLSFPTTVRGTVIRKAPRVRTKISTDVRSLRAGDQKFIGVISNLSAHGALLDAPRNFAEEGDRLVLTFRLKLHDVENNLNLQAVVRAVSDDEKARQAHSSLAHFGLEFADLQPTDQMLLKSMVYQKIIEDPQSMA
jgi:c-di-GMP-binding flagellar brake protein YcgR